MAALDILFLNLHRRYLNVEPNYGGFIGIYILSAFARQEGYEAKGYSGSLEKGLQILDELCAAEKVSMIGLYCDYENITENIFISRHVKEKYNLPVIVGGPQATALKENFFIVSKCDAVVRYEGEITVLELMNFYLEGVGELENILGTAYLTENGLKINSERPLIKNLDALPFIDAECYLDKENFYLNLGIMTGRGCPFHCAFCHEGAHTRQVRFRSVENVLAEVDAYLKNFPADEEIYIFFTDDTFTLNTERVKRICMGLAERRKNHNLKFFCEGHIHTLYKNPEMIEYLAEGGCIRMQIGLEAGTERILKAYGKNTTPEEIFEVVRRCRDAGIQQIYGNIILGGAFFSREIFEADKKFVQKLILESQGVVEIGVVTFWPLAETKMTRCPADFGMKICDPEFITSVGDFPQTETAELDRWTIAEMRQELHAAVFSQMAEMLKNWQVPTERILSWFPKSRHNNYGMWYNELRRQEILYAYYEILKIGEGFQSAQIENLAAAHPMRVAILYKYLKRLNESTVEICGEKFFGKELEILLMTTGKLSVEEISARVKMEIPKVLEVLTKLERKHLIVYILH